MDGLSTGMVLGERYRLTGPAGDTGPGTVWRAVDDVTMREVIVKALTTYPADDQAAWERARLALRVIAGLQHPGVAGVRDYLQAPVGGQIMAACLVRELVPGQTLEERLASGPLPAADALGVVAAVAGILADVHQAGLVHGNLVPANVVLSPGGVRITDVGLWVLRDRPAVAVFPSALSYAAPERAAGGPATPAADMYSLGVVFAACLTGIAAGGSAGAAVLAEPPGEPAAAGLASLWAACLGASPQDRPSAAHAAVVCRQLMSAVRPDAPVHPAPGTAGAPVHPAPGTLPHPAPGVAVQPAPGAAAHLVPGAPGQAVPPSGTAPSAPGPGRFAADPDPGTPAFPAAAGQVPPRTRRRERAGRRGASRRPPGHHSGRLGIARRGGLVALSGAATGVTVAVVAVMGLVMAPGPAPGPGAAYPAHTWVTAGPSATARQHGGAPQSTSSAPAVLPPVTVAPATAIPAPQPQPALSPAAAIGQLWQTVRHGAADGQIRQDVAVDFSNLIQPVRSQLMAGEPAQVGQFVTTMRGKIAARLSEGAITAGIARVMDGELSQLAASSG